MNSAAKRRPRMCDYAVGYGRPPEHSRFRKGESGNPRGRPRGRKRDIPFTRLDEAFRNAMTQPLAMTLDGKRVTTTRGEAIVHRLVAEALNGDHRAIKLCCHLMRELGMASEAAMTHEDRLAELARDLDLETP